MSSRTSKKASRFISYHISKHRRKGMEQDQAVAAAFSEARRKGYQVKKRDNPGGCPACHGIGLVHN